jgi:MFS superfamily sulfate permease-like transporter
MRRIKLADLHQQKHWPESVPWAFIPYHLKVLSRKKKYYLLSFLKHDLRASVSVFFVALPLCLGVAMASNTPVISGLLAGIIGGLVVPLISRSHLSVSGPAAGLTTICAAAIIQMSLETFFLSVAIAGLLQLLLGVIRAGGFTQFIPSAVIKGMLAAIGIILISKQIPPLIGYDKPDFWSNELFNIITFNHAFSNIKSLFVHSSNGPLLISLLCFLFLYAWKKTLSKKLGFIPSSFVVVLFGVLLALALNMFPAFSLDKAQFVTLPANVLSTIHKPNFGSLFSNIHIWKNAVVICFVATLETLLSVAAIDKLDPYNRITPENRELVAQGSANFLSGMLGGLPITAVIVRSAANAEAGAKTKLSAFTHGAWLLLAILFAIPLINAIPYCVLAVILIRTGYNLAKPKMITGIYRQGREQFMPFLITVVSILLTDLLIGVLIGIVYALYFLVKHTYRAGFTITERTEGHTKHYTIDLALNVSFLNKKRLTEMLDTLSPYSIVEVSGTKCVYIDHDVLEIFHDFRSKARSRHIELVLKDIPDVETIELH